MADTALTRQRARRHRTAVEEAATGTPCPVCTELHANAEAERECIAEDAAYYATDPDDDDPEPETRGIGVAPHLGYFAAPRGNRVDADGTPFDEDAARGIRDY